MFLGTAELGSYVFNGRFWLDGKPQSGLPAKGYFDLASAHSGFELTGHYYNVKGDRRPLSVKVTFPGELPLTGEFQVKDKSEQVTRGVVVFLDSDYLLAGLWNGLPLPLSVRVTELGPQAWGISGVLHIPDLLP